MQLNWSRRSLGGGGRERRGEEGLERGEFWEMSVPREKHNLCVPLGCLIAEKQCFKQKYVWPIFYHFITNPGLFGPLIWLLVFSFRMNVAAFSRPRLFTKGGGYWAGKGGERGFYKLDALALYLRLLNNTPSRYWLAPSPILFVIFCSFV